MSVHAKLLCSGGKGCSAASPYNCQGPVTRAVPRHSQAAVSAHAHIFPLPLSPLPPPQHIQPPSHLTLG